MPVEERDAARASGERETTTGRTTSETTTPSAFKKRGGTTRANARKRAKESESDDANESDHDDDNEPERARKRRQGGIAASSREVKGGAYERFALEGTRAVGARGDMGATAQLEINTAKEMDGRTMREQVLRQAVERADGFEDDKKYRGTNAYVDYRAGFRR